MISQKELLKRMKKITTEHYISHTNKEDPEDQADTDEVVECIKKASTISDVVKVVARGCWDVSAVINLIVEAATGKELEDWDDLPTSYDT